MTYRLNFALKLSRETQKDSSVVIYDPKSFDEKPIPITTNTVSSIIKKIIINCEEVGLTDKKDNLNKVEPKGTENSTKDNSVFQNHTNLQLLEGKAYICEVKKLKKEVLNQICDQIVESFKEKLENLSSENLLDPQNYDFSAMQELIELRNYLIRYVKSNKPMYLDGYIYIFED